MVRGDGAGSPVRERRQLPENPAGAPGGRHWSLVRRLGGRGGGALARGANEPAAPDRGAQAAHVVEIMEAVHRSAREGRAIQLAGDFPLPEPQPWAR